MWISGGGGEEAWVREKRRMEGRRRVRGERDGRCIFLVNGRMGLGD